MTAQLFQPVSFEDFIQGSDRILSPTFPNLTLTSLTR
jgi:hypothetical protein